MSGGGEGGANETSPPETLPASRGGRCRAAGGVAFCEGASLSDAAGQDRRAGRAERQLRHCGSGPGGPTGEAARPDRGGGKSWRRRNGRRNAGGHSITGGRLHAARRWVEQRRV